ncbi:MAG: ABC transporter substrate-binding protein [Candidatus Limnocylindrales bacterium]
MARTNRERLLALLGSALLIVSVTACSGSTSSPAASEPPASQGASQPAATDAPSESAAPATGCVVGETLTPISFQLNFTAGGYNSGFALALQRKYYEEVGLNVTIVKGQGSGTTAKLVASGQAGLAYADAVAAMQVIAKGAKIKLLSTMYQSGPNAINALATSGIKTITDLKGKTLGEPVGEAGTAQLPILLEANGMTLDDIKRVPMPGTSLVAALIEGQVDAIIGSTEGYNIVLEEQGHAVTVLPFADFGVPTVSTSMLASEAFLATNGNEVRCFIQASLRGWDEAIKDPDAAIEALVTTFPYDTRPALNKRQLESAINLFCKNDAKFVGKAEPVAWERTVKIAEQVLKLPPGIPATDYYTYDYLPETLPTSCPLK